MNGEPNELKKKPASPWVWAGCGCLALIGAGIAFVALIVFVVFAAIRSSEPYTEGLARARADARVQEALGAPIEPGWLLSGSIETKNRSGVCDITIPLNGSKQTGVLYITGTKIEGRWTYSKIRVVPASGPPIDLVDAGGASADRSGGLKPALRGLKPALRS